MTAARKLAAAALAAAGLAAGATATGATSGADHCSRLLPKGGGTVVHGTFVPLDANEYLLLCTTAARRTK